MDTIRTGHLALNRTLVEQMMSQHGNLPVGNFQWKKRLRLPSISQVSKKQQLNRNNTAITNTTDILCLQTC